MHEPPRGGELAVPALLAALLSPTDAALGQAVITCKTVPEPIREALNLESGPDDGIALPPIFALLFALGATWATPGPTAGSLPPPTSSCWAPWPASGAAG